MIAAARAAPASESISGLLGPVPSSAPLFFEVRPKGAAPEQYLQPAGAPPLFSYFAIRGLGEVPRLMLAEIGAPYDHMATIGGEDQAMCANWRSRSPNGLLPTLSGLGLPKARPLSQSGSIIRFLAKKYGMTGATVEDDARADWMYETANDLSKHTDALLAAGPSADKDMAPKGPYALALRLELALKNAPRAADHDAALDYGQIQLLYALFKLEERCAGLVGRLGAGLDEFRVAGVSRPRIKAYLEATGYPMQFPATFGELGKEGYNYASGPLVRGEL